MSLAHTQVKDLRCQITKGKCKGLTGTIVSVAAKKALHPYRILVDGAKTEMEYTAHEFKLLS